LGSTVCIAASPAASNGHSAKLVGDPQPRPHQHRRGPPCGRRVPQADPRTVPPPTTRAPRTHPVAAAADQRGDPPGFITGDDQTHPGDRTHGGASAGFIIRLGCRANPTFAASMGPAVSGGTAAGKPKSRCGHGSSTTPAKSRAPFRLVPRQRRRTWRGRLTTARPQQALPVGGKQALGVFEIDRPGGVHGPRHSRAMFGPAISARTPLDNASTSSVTATLHVERKQRFGVGAAQELNQLPSPKSTVTPSG